MQKNEFINYRGCILRFFKKDIILIILFRSIFWMFGGYGNLITNQQVSQKSKKYFQDNKLSGLYQEFDQITKKLKE